MLSPVAQISKTYGSFGEVLVRVNSSEFESYLEDCISGDFKEPVFIYYEGLPVPFFIRSAKHRSGNAYVVVFTTIGDEKRAQEFVGQNLYIDNQVLRGDNPADDNGLEIDDFSVLHGFTILNQNDIEVGKIVGVMEFPANICLEVKRTFSDSEPVLIPLHEDLIIRLSESERILKLHIADGLF
ncbi:MAG: ribosome maturation factor RimM [Candidatus Egerieousia sp.]